MKLSFDKIIATATLLSTASISIVGLYLADNYNKRVQIEQREQFCSETSRNLIDLLISLQSNRNVAPTEGQKQSEKSIKLAILSYYSSGATICSKYSNTNIIGKNITEALSEDSDPQIAVSAKKVLNTVAYTESKEKVRAIDTPATSQVQSSDYFIWGGNKEQLPTLIPSKQADPQTRTKTEATGSSSSSNQPIARRPEKYVYEYIQGVADFKIRYVPDYLERSYINEISYASPPNTSYDQKTFTISVYVSTDIQRQQSEKAYGHLLSIWLESTLIDNTRIRVTKVNARVGTQESRYLNIVCTSDNSCARAVAIAKQYQSVFFEQNDNRFKSSNEYRKITEHLKFPEVAVVRYLGGTTESIFFMPVNITAPPPY